MIVLLNNENYQNKNKKMNTPVGIQSKVAHIYFAYVWPGLCMTKDFLYKNFIFVSRIIESQER